MKAAEQVRGQAQAQARAPVPEPEPGTAQVSEQERVPARVLAPACA
jgi:hypothetical protein